MPKSFAAPACSPRYSSSAASPSPAPPPSWPSSPASRWDSIPSPSRKKGDEVWRVLSSAKKEFETYGGLMQKVEDQVGTVQNTIQKLGVRTRAINKALKNVSNPANLDAGAPISNLIGFDEISSVAPLLAASSDEE